MIDKDLADLLQMKMSEISEQYWAAGWMSGLATDLWAVLRDPSCGLERGYPLTPEQIADLRRIAERAGCWWNGRMEAVPLDIWAAEHGELPTGGTATTSRQTQPTVE